MAERQETEFEFLDYPEVKWESQSLSIVEKLLSRIEGEFVDCCPANPERLTDLRKRFRYLSKAVGRANANAHSYTLLQAFVAEAETLVKRWEQLVAERPDVRPARRPPKKPSRAIENLTRVVTREHAAEIRSAI